MQSVSHIIGYVLLFSNKGLFAALYAWLIVQAFRESKWWGAVVVCVFPIGGWLYTGQLMEKTKVPLYCWILSTVMGIASMIFLDLAF